MRLSGFSDSHRAHKLCNYSSACNYTATLLGNKKLFRVMCHSVAVIVGGGGLLK